jgi:hypothetical protein
MNWCWVSLMVAVPTFMTKSAASAGAEKPISAAIVAPHATQDFTLRNAGIIPPKVVLVPDASCRPGGRRVAATIKGEMRVAKRLRAVAALSREACRSRRLWRGSQIRLRNRPYDIPTCAGSVRRSAWYRVSARAASRSMMALYSASRMRDQAAARGRRSHALKSMRPRRASPNGTSERSSTGPPGIRWRRKFCEL